LHHGGDYVDYNGYYDDVDYYDGYDRTPDVYDDRWTTRDEIYNFEIFTNCMNFKIIQIGLLE